MTTIKSIGGLLLAGTIVSGNALAETYDYQLDVGYQSSKFKGSQTTTTPGGIVFNTVDTDTDSLNLVGTWYFAGLSDDKGPRARAALVDRASSLSIAYSSIDLTSDVFLESTDPAISFPGIDQRFESDGDSFAVALRYVDRESGWFGGARLLNTDVAVGGFVDDSVDATGWGLSAGKYLFDTTTLGLSVTDVDSDASGDATSVTVTIEHLGDLGDTWQYAVDLFFDRTDPGFSSDIDTIGAAISFYPTTDFEFGFRVEDRDGFLGQSDTGVEGFVSWFVKPNVQLAAGYRVDDVSFLPNAFIGGAPTETSTGQDSFGISASIRF